MCTVGQLEDLIERQGPAGTNKLTALTLIKDLEGNDIDFQMSMDGTLRVVPSYL